MNVMRYLIMLWLVVRLMHKLNIWCIQLTVIMFNSEYRMSHGISLWQVKRRTSSKLNSGTFWQRYGEYSAKTVLVVLRLIKPTGTDYIYQRTVVLYFMTVSGASYSIWSILYSMDRGKWMKWRWIMYIWCNISTIFYYCMLIRRINMWSTWD